MTGADARRHALVFGASGLIGRHLMLNLAAAGAEVTAAVRTPASAERTERWLRAHGLVRSIRTAIVDFDADEILPGGPAAFDSVTEIHNCAATFRFGMTAQEARGINVGIVEKVIDFAAALPHLTRLVHVSGYRVGGQDPATVPWTEEHRAAVYRRLGAYEASKVESDAIFQARATELGVAWTIANPASVIGDSESGESEQLIGLGTTVEQLWNGATAALPGGESVFLPVVTVDYLAAFMAAAAVDPAAAGQSYWLLDDDTPPLADMLAGIGHHLGARVPRLRVPVSVITRLPQRITGADPETLHFMSTDRYPTQSAIELAGRHGLAMPDVHTSLQRWADYLAAHRFGAAASEDRRFVDAAGVRTFVIGDPAARRLVLPGLPVNADTWAGTATRIGARAVDLPGLGLSGGSGMVDWDRWLPAVLGEESAHLVGHSIGSAAAVLAADQFPSRVASLTLVAPFFLQPASARMLWIRPLVSAALRHTDAAGLSVRLTGTDANAGALESSASDLRRATASRVAAHLAHAGSPAWRAELRTALARFRGPIRIITGTDDPLDAGGAKWVASLTNVEMLSLPGAGHHPQLTHQDALIDALSSDVRGAVASTTRTSEGSGVH